MAPASSSSCVLRQLMSAAAALVVALLLCAAAAAATLQEEAAGRRRLSSSSSVVYRVLTLQAEEGLQGTSLGSSTSSSSRRNKQQLTCPDPKTKKPGCMTKCDKRCPNQCIVTCPGCKTYCMCDLYPGMSCGDPRFTGGDGNTFYFHGSKDQNFCVFTDAGLHINAHFIGRRDPAMTRDFTWIQALGITFFAAADHHHRLYLGARKTASNKWRSDVDRLDLAFDGEPIAIPTQAGATWAWRSSSSVPASSASALTLTLTVTRTAATNGVRLQLHGGDDGSSFDIVANVVPITQEESRTHNYGVVTEDVDGDTFAHLDLGFRFLDLTDDVHGVLGQTYRSDYVNQLSVSSSMPTMGGAASYLSSDIFATDCAVSRFGARHAVVVAAEF